MYSYALSRHIPTEFWAIRRLGGSKPQFYRSMPQPFGFFLRKPAWVTRVAGGALRLHSLPVARVSMLLWHVWIENVVFRAGFLSPLKVFDRSGASAELPWELIEGEVCGIRAASAASYA